VLNLVDAVACEDTRVSAQLLRAYGLHKPLLAVHEHNEREAVEQVASRLLAGERIALISDAGTPAVSDPGARLVQGLRERGLRCVPIPGASSALAALSVAGDALSQGFDFIGFLPPKGEARKSALQRLVGQARTQILFEAPHRVQQFVAELAEAAPSQALTMARELTKQFEQIETLAAAAWPARLAELDAAGAARGEFVWLLHAAPAVESSGIGDAAERLLAALLPLLPTKQAVALVAEHCGAARNAVYARALELKQGD
jgi:16S rRNA (cytidine1402-2'-O)-methyltransferase